MIEDIEMNDEQSEEVIDLSSLEVEDSVILHGNSWQTWN